MSGYAVRDVPRGVIVGHVGSLRLRNWIGSCLICGAEIGPESTRPAAERLLKTHVRRVHWAPTR